MAQLQRPFRRTVGTHVRRKTSWTFGPNGRPAAFTTNVARIFPIGFASTLDGLTLVRVRGNVSIGLESATAVNDGFDQVGIGLAIVNNNAFTVGGVGSVPTPLTDMEWDGWLWYWTGNIMALNTGASVGQGLGQRLIEIDGKAMRKWKETDVLMGVVETAGLNGAVSMQTVLNTRILTKLP